MRFNKEQGWVKIGRRYHYFRLDASLCGDVRVERSPYTSFELDPDIDPLPDDCKACWEKWHEEADVWLPKPAPEPAP